MLWYTSSMHGSLHEPNYLSCLKNFKNVEYNYVEYLNKDNIYYKIKILINYWFSYHYIYISSIYFIIYMLLRIILSLCLIPLTRFNIHPFSFYLCNLSTWYVFFCIWYVFLWIFILLSFDRSKRKCQTITYQWDSYGFNLLN